MKTTTVIHNIDDIFGIYLFEANGFVPLFQESLTLVSLIKNCVFDFNNCNIHGQ